MTEGQLLCVVPTPDAHLVRGAHLGTALRSGASGRPRAGTLTLLQARFKERTPLLSGPWELPETEHSHTVSGPFPRTKGKRPRCLPPPTSLSHILNTHYRDTLGTGQVMGGVRSLALEEGSRNCLTHRTSRARE